MRFFIVDAFTEKIFGGNPAGIVLLGPDADFPDEDVMTKTAAELRYSETAFVKPVSDKELKLRYFTPEAEVDFCGHATIAAFTVLSDTGFAKAGSSYLIDTLSGKLAIDIKDDSIMMEMPAPKLIKGFDDPGDIEELYKILGIDPGRGSADFPPELISTGFPDIFLYVKDYQSLGAIAPDFGALSAFTKKHGAGGVHVFTLDVLEPGITARARNFAPLFGINEEAATGTASGGLIYYLFLHGAVSARQSCYFLQGEAMGRPSKISASIESSDLDCKIKVGGKGAILASGEIHL